MQVSTIAQLTIVAPAQECEADHPLCILNTHLFYHPRANHLRTIHTAVMMAEAKAAIDQVTSSEQHSALLRGKTPSLIFCGDLNSGLNKGVPGLPCLGSQSFCTSQ